MKPKTKKTLIIVAAVLAVAVIVYLVFFRKAKGSTSAVIARLNCDATLKDALTSMVDNINTSWDEAHKNLIAEHATTYGRTVAQQTVAEALYALYDAGQIDAATYNSVLSQI